MCVLFVFNDLCGVDREFIRHDIERYLNVRDSVVVSAVLKVINTLTVNLNIALMRVTLENKVNVSVRKRRVVVA